MWIIRACLSSLLGYVFPRLLIALGVPIDAWIVAAAAWLSIYISLNAALWLATFIVAGALYYLTLWYSGPRTFRRPNLGLEQEATPIVGPATKRSFDTATQQQFVGLLNKRLPDKGWVEIKYVAIQLRPFAQRLDSLFKSANWQTNLNPEPISSHQVQNVDGIGISGFNEYFVDTVITVFREAGVTDIRREILKNEMPRTHVKWEMTQKRVNIEIGFPQE